MKKKLITTALVTAAAAGGAMVLSMRGRRDHPGLEALRGWSYAHRGLHGNGVPENSMAAFRLALEHGFGIELDLHLMADGNLAVIHDTSLQRTAGAEVAIHTLTAGELPAWPLEGTGERIPLFPQVLALFAGKAPLIIELKVDENNHQALVDATMAALEGYQGPWCIESFDPRVVRYLRDRYPQAIRGQLSGNYFKGRSPLPAALKFLLKHNMLNFLTLPDFIAYDFSQRNDTLSTHLCRKVWGIQCVGWTLRSQQAHDQALQEQWLPIFENYIPE